MTSIYATLTVLGARAADTVRTAQLRLREAADDERGLITLEGAIWAAALVLVAGLVIAAIVAVVRAKTAEIK